MSNQYDAIGQLLQSTDPMGAVTSYQRKLCNICRMKENNSEKSQIYNYMIFGILECINYKAFLQLSFYPQILKQLRYIILTLTHQVKEVLINDIMDSSEDSFQKENPSATSILISSPTSKTGVIPYLGKFLATKHLMTSISKK